MFSFLRRLFGREPPVDWRAPEPLRPTAPEPPAPPAAQAVAPAAAAPLLEGFARYQGALGISTPRVRALSDNEEERLGGIARALDERLAEVAPSFEAFPAACSQVLQLVSDPEVGMGALARVIGQDPGLSAAVLRVANSSFYRSLRESQTLREAIARLGATEVARLAGAASVHALFSSRGKAAPRPLQMELEELHLAAVSNALAASWLALRKRGARSDRAYLGGLLHDLGKAVVLRAAASLVQDDDSRVRFGDPLLARAVELLHARVGGEMAARWSLPAFVAATCLHHHDGAIEPGDDAADLHVVRLVAALRELRKDPVLHCGAPQAIAESAAFLAIEPAELRLIDAEVQRLRARASSLLAA